MHALVFDKGAKRVGFGSQAERDTGLALIAPDERESAKLLAEKQKKQELIKRNRDAFHIETYDASDMYSGTKRDA